MRELSQITGLSTAAVSYALRGQRVSAETEARVRAAAARIDFRSDPIARALRGGRTELVGVVGGSLDDHWHQEFVAALQRALRDHGLRMVLADAAWPANRPAWPRCERSGGRRRRRCSPSPTRSPTASTRPAANWS